MAQEKDMGFTVSDKRSSYKDAAEPTPTPQASAPATSPAEASASQATTEPEQAGSMPFPEANLLTLMFSLYTHTQICLGVLPDPVTQQPQKDLPQAKYNIDLLEVLQQKTRGNLTNEEEQTLESILYDVRMAFVAVNK
jgi:hypothetical protein